MSCSSCPPSTRSSAAACATSPRSEIAPHAAQWDKDHHFPVDVVQKMGDLGLMGLDRARGVRRRRRGRRLHLALRRDRGDRPRRPVDGHHPRGRRRPRHQPDPDLRHRRAEAAVAARPGRRPHAGRLRPHRAGRRLRRRRHPHQGRARRRRVGRQRRQAVHHQLRLRDHLAGDGHGPHRHPRRAATAGPSLDGHHPVRHARLHRRAGLRQARLARLRHPPAVLRGRPRPRGQPARRAGPRLRPVPRHPRRRPGRDRRTRGRLHPGLPRHVAGVRRRAPDVRRPDRPQAGRRLPDRRPRGDAARQPAAHLQGGRDEGRRPRR